MFAILPVTLLGVAVVVVAAMPWRRPHPNHLFMPELLETHLHDGPELRTDPAEERNSGGQNRGCVRLQIDNVLRES
jgi:hypothetical protein